MRSILRSGAILVADFVRGSSSQGAAANARAELEAHHFSHLQGAHLKRRVEIIDIEAGRNPHLEERYALQASAVA